METPTPESLTGFRDLHELMLDYEGTDLFADVLAPSIPRAQALLAPLRSYGDRRALTEVSDEALHAFFALSVVNDTLLLPLRVSLREYLRFFEALGFAPFSGGDFSPVRHELVEVSNHARPDEGIQLGRTYWPGLMWGELVFSRSAVDAFCHPSFQLHADVVRRSPLYFASSRMRRPTHSLAHGWGSNSRWRTPFRLDYEEPGHVVFNAFAKHDLADPSSWAGDARAAQDLPLGARRELLVHRSFVSYAPGPDEECFPYNDTLALRRDGPLWPLEESRLVRVRDLKADRTGGRAR
ncbi:hypothetical protein [Melittangium boletus]|uniref:hypothetical protein n=1 Tax=Melittangium boletus TaxID=83453 RepID=UPI003DA36401